MRFLSSLFVALALFSFSQPATASDVAPIRATIGQAVTLDPTDGFEAATGQSYRFEWQWTERPATSVATFSASNVLRPQVTPDVPGQYVAEMQVFREEDSAGTPPVETVLIMFGTENLAPVAQITGLGVPGGSTPLTLDGSDSYDVDGDAVSYQWQIVTSPADSAAALSASDAVLTELSLDEEGRYVVGLTVQDSVGNASAQALYELDFLPNSGSTDVYRLAWDTVHGFSNGIANTLDLGDVSAGSGLHYLVNGFALGEDSVTLVLEGVNHSLSDAQSVLDFAAALNLDIDGATSAQVSPNEAVTDVTFIFGDGNGSITFKDLIGVDLARAQLLDLGAGTYTGVGGHQVGPVASGRFDQLTAVPGEAITLEPYTSTDIDGSVLVARAGIAASPAAGDGTLNTDIDGLSVFTATELGDYLLSYEVSDATRSGHDQVLITVGSGNLRPVARIAPVTDTVVGQAIQFDGSQSYDLNGDLIAHDWALISKPSGSAAALSDPDRPFAVFTPDEPGYYVVQLQTADGSAASVPVTHLIKVAGAAPLAEAGPDRLAGDLGHLGLDGTLSSGEAPISYAWASIGLTGNGSSGTLDDPSLALPTISLDIREGRFRDVISMASVYHLKRSDNGGLCQFDTRLPADLGGTSASEPVFITLHARGKQGSGDGTIQVWEIENKNDHTRQVDLIDENGTSLGSYTVPGQVSVHVVTPDTGKDDVTAYVNGVAQDTDDAKKNPFNRNNPVCTGPGAGVVQLVVTDADGISRPDTAFIGNANLRPVLSSGPRLELISGEDATQTAAGFGVDANGDTINYSWAMISRPDGSTASLGTQIVDGDSLTFTPDRVGVYLVQLMADDGAMLAVPAVFEVEVVNSPPVAVASGPAERFVGETAVLDGSGSFDIDGDALAYQWSLLSRPEGSTANIVNDTGVQASFAPDRRGDYVFQLVVSDYEFDSDPVTLSLTVPNRAPVAIFDGPAEIDVNAETVYSAAGSTDPDNDPLSFTYSVVSAPAGAAPYITNLGNGEAGFIADLPGDYVLQAEMSDGLLTSSQQITVTARSLNAPPILGDLRDIYTVELGLELALELQGSDPDGDAISFFATPLPLETGISLDAASGAVRFRPETGQLGTYSFTVGVSDGTLTDNAVLTIEVVEPTAGDTGIFGRVLDARDNANGVITPLADMPVRLRDAALMTTTDAQGNFDFGSLGASARDQVIIEPSANGGPGGYLGTVRAIAITENQNRDLSPDFLLVPLDDGCTTVVAGQDTVLNGAASGVSVTIPADTIQDAAGAAYTGEVCLGSLPDLFAHPGFDEDTRACRIYALDAPGAVFTQGMTVSAPNLDNLPEPTNLEMWRLSNLNGLFRLTANAGVDTGGATVSATAGNFNAGTLFTFLPQAPATVASVDQPTGMQQLTPFEGDNATSYTLPGYTAFGEAQQVGLSYHSKAANPTIVLAGDVTIADDASLPVTLRTRLNVGGLSVDDQNQWTPRQGLDGSTPALIGEAVTLRQSLPLDGSGLEAGRYGYEFVAKAQYDCSTVAASHMAELYVQNESQSPYGNGWSITGLQKLVLSPDGKVSIHDDNSVTTFDPKPTLTEFEDEPLVFPTIGTQNVRAIDIDQNGLLDVTFGESGTGSIGLITNFGNGDLRLDAPLQVGNPVDVPQTGTYTPNLLTVEVGELTNDGAADIAYALQLQDGYGIVENDGFGRFSKSYERLDIPDRPTDLVVADMDGDGFEDLVYTGFSSFFGFFTDYIYVDFGGATGRVNRRIINSGFFNGALPLQVLTADIDGDGRLDVAYRTRQGVDFGFNNGNRNFAGSRQRLGGAASRFLGEFAKFIDANQDGLLDLVWSGDDRLEVFINTGGRSFAAPVSLARPPSAGAAGPINIADANGDGIDDIVFTSGDVNVYLGNGDGTFQPFETGFIDYPVNSIDVADINGDGSLDLLSTQRFSVTVHFSKPSASGEFVSGDGEFSTLERLADGTWQRRYKDGTIIEYDAGGLQTAMVDPQGNRKKYGYGPDGRLATITDQVGGVTSFTYDVDGRAETITYPDGRVTAFEYDDIGNLNQITEPTGSQVSFAYDENGRLVSSTNQNGNTTAYTYDAVGSLNGASLPDGSSISNQVASSLGLVDGLGGPATQPLIYVAPEDRVTTVTDRKGQVTEIIVNQFGSTVQVTDPLGRVTKIERNHQNLAVRVERPSDAIAGGVRVDTVDYDDFANVLGMSEAVGTPEERTTAYTYELTYNKPLTMTDPDGFTTSYEYDAFGETTKITDPEGGEQLFSYTPEGKLATRTDKNGNATAFTYNTDLNLDSITYADGSVTQMTYDATGNTAVIAEAAGTTIERQVQRTYDALNRVLSVEVTGADGVQIDGLTQYSYLPAGNLATVTDETGLVTSMSYDGLERLISVNDPAEGLIQRVYNEAGEVTQHVNGDGETHQYAYDEVSRLTQTTDPEGHVKSFAYDSRDNISTVTDGRGGLTSFGYDGLDRMTTRTNPISQTMTRAYDGRDNLLTLTREDGAVETASYDGLGRRTQVVTPDNTLSYAYDARGNLIEAADDDSRVTFTYDNRNRLASTTTDGTVGPQPQVTLSYAYDALDRRTSMSDSLGGTTTYAYDPEDRLTDLTAPWGTVYSFSYDGEGRRTSLTSTSGRVTNYAYTNGLLSALSHAQSGVALTDLNYQYGPDGQLTGIIDNLDPAKSKFISYDDLNRLVQVDEGVPIADGGTPIPVEDYAYDGEGNRTASHLSTLYSSNDHNQLLEDDSYTYAYDLKGNRISRTSKATGDVESYTYDSQNRLVGYASPTTTASYSYDAMERRIGKAVDEAQTAYVYDMSVDDPLAHDDITLEFDTSGPAILTRRWAHSNAVDEPVGFEEYGASSGVGSGSERAMFSDRQGSVIWVTDPASGSVVAAYEYDGFGKISQTQGALEQPYGYTGREYDAESGLYYYRARAYDPQLGTFVQSDPIGFYSGQFSLYNYVSSDPYGWGDPSGLSAAVECGVGRTSGGACGTLAGATAGISVAINSLARRIAIEIAKTAVMSVSNEDAEANSGDKSDSPACQAARKEFEDAKAHLESVGGGCSTSATTKRQRKLWRTPEVQAMLFRRLMALQRFRAARENRDNACHGFSDDVHQTAIDELQSGIDRCVRALNTGDFK